MSAWRDVRRSNSEPSSNDDTRRPRIGVPLFDPGAVGKAPGIRHIRM
jgi:hypothetical protein